MQLSGTTVETAWQLLAAGHFAEASSIAHGIVERSPDNVAALSCAAVADWECGGDVSAALALLYRAAHLAPHNAAVWHNLATLEASRGDIAAARTGFEQALRIDPADTRAFFSLTQNSRFETETDLVRQMLELYGTGALDRTRLEFLCFGLAKVYADIGNPSRAMHFCIEANWLADRPWDRNAERQRLASIRALAGANGFARARGTRSGPMPVFIVGMPRSGTTLVEAILARHKGVHALGETTLIADIDQRLVGGDVRRLPGLGPDSRRRAADGLMTAMCAGGRPETRIVTDKTPANAFHLGLIASLFPNARIIHVRRHPLDCGLSNLFTRFTRGQGFAFRQPDLGERIRQTAEVMALWRGLDLLPILDVSYETLVAQPESAARRMTDFLSLDWDAACLAPDRGAYAVRTASQFQVRQKIYGSSVGRHAGYREWLAPLVAALGGDSWIEAEFADQQQRSQSS